MTIPQERTCPPQKVRSNMELEFCWLRPETAGPVVADWLSVAFEVGFHEVALVSGRLETIRRPTLGLLGRVHFSATNTRLHRPAIG